MFVDKATVLSTSLFFGTRLLIEDKAAVFFETKLIYWGQGCCIKNKAAVLAQQGGTRLLYLGQGRFFGDKAAFLGTRLLLYWVLAAVVLRTRLPYCRQGCCFEHKVCVL